MRYCMICGDELGDDDLFCRNCGEKVGSVEPVVKISDVSDSGVEDSSEDVHYYSSSSESLDEDGEYNETTILWISSVSKGGKKKAKPEIPPDEDEEDDATDVVARTDYYLDRVGTRERILLRMPCVVGRGRASDCRIEGNKAISREHVKMCLENGAAYVEDLLSTNHTCLNGVQLDRARPTPIKNGDTLRLGNEDFVFAVEDHV